MDTIDDVASFQRKALEVVLALLVQHNVRTSERLNELKARKLLEEPLWKLLELQGKYGGRYISEGVRELEVALEKRVSASTGKWPERTLRERLRLGPAPSNQQWRDQNEYCCALEHVSERKNLVDELLLRPHAAQSIVDQHLFGCVILRCEHGFLREGKLDIDDVWVRYRGRLRVWDRETQQYLF